VKPGRAACSSGKRSYGVREHAENLAARLRAARYYRSGVYRCPECGLFHVTTRGGHARVPRKKKLAAARAKRSAAAAKHYWARLTPERKAERLAPMLAALREYRAKRRASKNPTPETR
jgi:hypothetical protein